MLKEDLLLLFNNATQAARLMCRGISVQKRPTHYATGSCSRFLLSILCNYVVKRSNELRLPANPVDFQAYRRVTIKSKLTSYDL